MRDITGLGDRSAYGLPGESGVLLVDVPANSLAARAGLQRDDVILACNDTQTMTMADMRRMCDSAAGRKLALTVSRKQSQLTVEVADYAYVLYEEQPSPDFSSIPLKAAPAILAGKISSASKTLDEPLAVLLDGRLARNYGPVYGNGVQNGLYKLDLGASQSIAQVNTFSFNQNKNRGRQRFVLYASGSDTDPGWKVEDARLFTALAEVDTNRTARADFVATSIRQSNGKPLGSYRWLVWSIVPVTSNAGGENTAFQEFQVIPSP